MAFKRDMPTEAALLENELRLRVQRRIDGGRLPVALISQVEGSYGTARLCCVCDQPITRENVDYDVVKFCKTTCLSLSFHASCYVIWQRECAHRVANAKLTKLRDGRRTSQMTH
jgi:hypothetical protein